MTVTFTCPSCRAPLALGPDVVRCSCGKEYPSHFGIPDLRVGLRTAAGAFSVEADLAAARELNEEFTGRSYREWLTYRERRAEELVDPARRAHVRGWFASERQLFGVHGGAILSKIDAFLGARDPIRWARWRSSPRVALEAGCGTGQHPIGFSPRFGTVLVTDISYVSLLHAQKVAMESGLQNVVLFASNIEALPLADGSIDLFHCNEVIEHVGDPDAVVREAARALSETGLALILSPNRWTLWVEPHAHVAGYSFWPAPVRQWLLRRLKGTDDMSHTSLRSLGDVRRYARDFAQSYVYMLPPRLPQVAVGGRLRGAVRSLLNSPATGPLTDALLNHVFLAVMPYHVLLGFKR